MLNRLLFGFIILFWVVMNVLLWRSEFGGRTQLGSAVPVETVWSRMLTAPDDSSLDILREGVKIGYCRWVPNVGEELATGKVSQEELEGMVRKPAGYTITMEGNFLLDRQMGRLRFDFHAGFDANNEWKDFTLRVVHRPMAWELESVAADQTLKFRHEAGEENWERQYHFSDFQNPGKLLRQSGMNIPFLAGLLPQYLPMPSVQNVAAGLNWEARKDWLMIGHSRVRVYRVQARLLDKYQIVLIVSRVGEILRVELPNDILLVNEALSNL
jgi:hypothetical protein